MTIEQVGTLVSSLGFPVAAAVWMWMWTKQRIERSDKKSDEREDRMASRINELEDRIENRLTTVIEENTKAFREFATEMRNNRNGS